MATIIRLDRVTLDKHREFLKRLCRVCGKRAQKETEESRGKKAKLVISYKEQVQTTFGLDLDHDEEDIHPKNICKVCYSKLYLATKRSAYEWCSHPRNGQCTVCTLFKQQCKGGRPQKTITGAGRPKRLETPETHFGALRAQMQTVPELNDFEKFSPTSDIFNCKVCKHFLRLPVALPCNHVYCLQCILRICNKEQTLKYQCPLCVSKFSFKQVEVVKDYFLESFISSSLKCKTCNLVVPLKEVNQHKCDPDSLTKGIEKFLGTPLTSPLTPTLEKLGTHILKTKLAQSTDHISASFRTGGQQLVTICVPKARRKSDEASSSSKRQRTLVLERARDLVSGGSSSIQLMDEVAVQSRKGDLQNHLKSLQQIHIPHGDLLSLKANMCFSWKRNRELKGWLRQYGILTEGEGQLRRQQKLIIKDNTNAEYLPFSFPDEINGGNMIKQAACVSVKSLSAKVFQQLEEYDKVGKLTWHNGLIKDDKIWLKIGGDKGGCTFKMMAQIGNVTSPNSLNNTVVICAFEACDTIYNMQLGLLQLKEQVQEVMQSSWRGHTFDTFMFGDYEYLCRIYGLTGATGRHSCLYCTIEREQMKLPHQERRPVISRTLENMHADYKRFEDSGKNPKLAKNFNNVIRDPIFPIPICQVCPPALHISLGLFLKHFNSLESACCELDLKVAATLSKNPKALHEDNLGSSFQQYIDNIRSAVRLEKEAENWQVNADHLEEQLTATLIELADDNHPVVQMLAETIKESKDQSNEMKSKASQLRQNAKLKAEQGPIVSALDKTLQQFRVQRQAYHGKSFVGNHVHKCCKAENITKLTEAIITTTKAVCPVSPARQREAEQLATKYKKLFTLFANCHNTYNVVKPLDDAEIDVLDTYIKDYMAFFREGFPAETVPPKMHMLEEHIIPWVKRWGFGLGFHGEQGGESIHARLNTIRSNVRGFNDDLKILKTVVETHWIQTSPATIYKK